MEKRTVVEEVFDLIAVRVPPGDKWKLVDSNGEQNGITYSTLTDTLEAWFQKTQEQVSYRLDPLDSKNSEGGYLFKQGVIFRKISKFVTGTPEDQILPIPVFYDPTNGKVFTDNLRPELREEFEELYNKEDNK